MSSLTMAMRIRRLPASPPVDWIDSASSPRRRLPATSARNSAASCSPSRDRPWVSPGRAFSVSALRIDSTSGGARRVWAVIERCCSASVGLGGAYKPRSARGTTPPARDRRFDAPQEALRIARSISDSSSRTATASWRPSAPAASDDDREFLRRRKVGERDRRAPSGAWPGPPRRVIGAGLGSARLALGRDQRLEAARLLLDEILEAAGRDLLPLGMAEGRGELGQARLVVIDSEDELDDRGHRRADLRLDAQFLEQLGIFLRAFRAAAMREIIGERQSAIERGAGAALPGLDRFGGLARGPQAVGEPGVGVERDSGDGGGVAIVRSASGPSSQEKWTGAGSEGLRGGLSADSPAVLGRRSWPIRPSTSSAPRLDRRSISAGRLVQVELGEVRRASGLRGVGAVDASSS